MKLKTKIGLGLMVVGSTTIVSAQFWARQFAPKAEEIRVEAIQELTDTIALYGGAPIFGVGAGILLSRLIEKIRNKG